MEMAAMVVVMEMVAVDLVVTETIKDVVGLENTLSLNFGMACPGMSVLPS